MTDLYLDPATGDLSVSAAGVVRLTDGVLETVSQRLRIKLRTFMGEWFLDENVGVPYYQSILGEKNPDLGVIRSIFLDVLLSDPGVDSVPQLDVTLEGRKLIVVCEVYAIDTQVVQGVVTSATVPVVVASVSDPMIWFF